MSSTRKTGILSCALSLLLLPGVGPRANASSYVHNEVLVRFATGGSTACRDSILSRIGGTITDTLNLGRYWRIELADTNVFAAIATLDTCTCVSGAQWNQVPDSTDVYLTLPQELVNLEMPLSAG